MLTMQEPFVTAEVDFRRERIRAHFAAKAQQRAARRVRRLSAARQAASRLPGRLVPGAPIEGRQH